VTEENTAPHMPSPADLAANRPAPAIPADVADLPDGALGDPRVDAAMQRLDALDELPVSEHVEQYDALHRTLQDALATIDEG
jgi:hypothetical protein